MSEPRFHLRIPRAFKHAIKAIWKLPSSYVVGPLQADFMDNEGLYNINIQSCFRRLTIYFDLWLHGVSSVKNLQANVNFSPEVPLDSNINIKQWCVKAVPVYDVITYITTSHCPWSLICPCWTKVFQNRVDHWEQKTSLWSPVWTKMDICCVTFM